MFELLIKLLPFVFFLTLTACQGSAPQMQPGLNPSVEGGGPQTSSVLCNEWFKSLPTWADEDTELTKDEVDYAIRMQEEVCKPF